MAEILLDEEEEDDDLWIEDPYDEADDLAEHTMQSPVLINFDPTIDLDGDDDDCLEWSIVDGDFFDYEPPKRKRRKLDDAGKRNQTSSTKSSGPHTTSIEQIPELSLGDPISSDEDESFQHRSIVKWRIRGNSPRLPILEPGQQKKVSILKDWKERFKPPATENEHTKAGLANGNQRAIAVVIETNEKGHSLGSGSKMGQDLNKQAPKPTTTLSHRNKALNASETMQLRGASTPKKNSSTSTRKRKLSPSPEPAPEPTPKKQSTKLYRPMNQRIQTAQVGQKRKTREEEEDLEPPAKKTKPKASNDAIATKENVKPKVTAGAVTEKGSIQPKAAAVGRRSTRRK
ncbi:MAG: hypothetical protein Q9178_006933 [Gyalolechia marmorata]